MEIQGQAIQAKANTNQPTLPLRQGDVYGAKIETRISSNEAILSIRGQEVRATFSQPLPANDRVHVQIEGKTEDGVRVRVISEGSQRPAGEASKQQGPRNQLERVMQSLGQRQASPELKNAVAKFLDRGVPLTKETVLQLQQYMDKGKGTVEERMNTIDVASKKGLEPTTRHLQSIHEALHGKKVNEQIREVSNDKTASTRVSSPVTTERAPAQAAQNQVTRELIQGLERLKDNLNDNKTIRQTITDIQRMLATSENSHSKSLVLQALREVLQLQGQGKSDGAGAVLTQLISALSQQGQEVTATNTSNPQFTMISEWQTAIQNEGNLQQGLENLKSALASQGLPEQVSQLIANGITEAMSKLDQGRELKARQIIVNTLQQAKDSIPPIPNEVRVNESQQEILRYVTNEIMQTANLASKDILVTQVTEKLAQVTDSFKAFQRDVSHQLSRVNMMIEQFRAQSVQQTKPMLDKVIQQLDRALLKNDWLLFADMKTEKTVLKASSQLAEARNLLARGDYGQARQIVREVQTTLDKLQFKPENQKVQHFITRESQWQEARPETHRLSQQYEQVAKSLTQNQGSARGVFEGMRALGLNREAELGQILANKGQINAEQQRDIKSIMMRIARGEEEGTKVQQQAQQTVQNIAGQQLMGRVDHQQNMQMLLFQLPILLKGEADNLQVFVNSRNEGEKLDWENCSLYFLIETKRMGELGIGVNVVDRTLSITLKNDHPAFKDRVEPIAEKYLERIGDIGFNIQGLQFTSLTPAQSTGRVDEPQEEQLVPTMTKKGFDYKI